MRHKYRALAGFSQALEALAAGCAEGFAVDFQIIRVESHVQPIEKKKGSDFHELSRAAGPNRQVTQLPNLFGQGVLWFPEALENS